VPRRGRTRLDVPEDRADILDALPDGPLCSAMRRLGALGLLIDGGRRAIWQPFASRARGWPVRGNTADRSGECVGLVFHARLGAGSFFFFANLSFYLVMTLVQQKALQIPPLQPPAVFGRLALTSSSPADQSRAGPGRGTLGLIEGCTNSKSLARPGWLDGASLQSTRGPCSALVLMIFGFGPGLVCAIVRRGALDREARQAGYGSASWRHDREIANAAGVDAIARCSSHRISWQRDNTLFAALR